jgi:hypothetical protein
MMRYLVIFFWLCVFTYPVFHFRKTWLLRSYMQGFCDVWKSLIFANDEMNHDFGDAVDTYDYGCIAAVISVILVVALLIIMAVISIRGVL